MKKAKPDTSIDYFVLLINEAVNYSGSDENEFMNHVRLSLSDKLIIDRIVTVEGTRKAYLRKRPIFKNGDLVTAIHGGERALILSHCLSLPFGPCTIDRIAYVTENGFVGILSLYDAQLLFLGDQYDTGFRYAFGTDEMGNDNPHLEQAYSDYLCGKFTPIFDEDTRRQQQILDVFGL